MRFSGKSCKKLPTLSEVDAKRTEGSSGDRARRLLRGVEGTGFADLPETLRLVARRSLPVAETTRPRAKRESPSWYPDETLLRWLEGKVKDPFIISCLGRPAPVDSGSVPLRIPSCPELRSDAMSARGKAKAEKATRRQPSPTKGVVIREKRAINARGRAAGAGTSSHGGDVDLSPCRMLCCSKLLQGFAELELVKTQNRALKAENKLAELSGRIEARQRGGRSEGHCCGADKKISEAKELAIEDFKASGEFKAAVTDSAATYFSEGFEFCKRQLLHQFPNLGVDVANMAMDPSFAEEEEAAKEEEDPVAGAAPNV
ncbi:hypothetical protein Acr_24g0004160 [Actinidia rufa]|uniref:Uncharacterized protein n=1 Tax=Actinidia rufa TaxID=165716 RepID=A0A7J0GTW2_9ERIC|nr:hypothetical protein Acr_24g0004160 [Actinidia rufa]